jgi:hypothetical protein
MVIVCFLAGWLLLSIAQRDNNGVDMYDGQIQSRVAMRIEKISSSSRRRRAR